MSSRERFGGMHSTGIDMIDEPKPTMPLMVPATSPKADEREGQRLNRRPVSARNLPVWVGRQP